MRREGRGGAKKEGRASPAPTNACGMGDIGAGGASEVAADGFGVAGVEGGDGGEGEAEGDEGDKRGGGFLTPDVGEDEFGNADEEEGGAREAEATVLGDYKQR